MFVPTWYALWPSSSAYTTEYPEAWHVFVTSDNPRYEKLDDIRMRAMTYQDLSFVYLIYDLDKSLEYSNRGYELCKISANK